MNDEEEYEEGCLLKGVFFAFLFEFLFYAVAYGWYKLILAWFFMS